MKIAGKHSLSSRRWLDRQLHDPYVKKARSEGYRSRAAFKLIEIDDKFRLLRNAKSIVDLGAAPGGWSQLLVQRTVGAKIASVDIVHFGEIDGVQQFIGDFEDENIQHDVIEYLGGNADLIISDMAPATIGHANTDHLRIMNLVESSYDFAQNVLSCNGSFIAKIFQGGEEVDFLKNLRQSFQKVCFFKPKSSRSISVEIYVVAIGFKNAKK